MGGLGREGVERAQGQGTYINSSYINSAPLTGWLQCLSQPVILQNLHKVDTDLMLGVQ